VTDGAAGATAGDAPSVTAVAVDAVVSVTATPGAAAETGAARWPATMVTPSGPTAA
jgi:hypothetical protein